MSQQSNAAPASVTSLTPEPELSKSGIPLHMMDPLVIEEEVDEDDMPQSLEEALMS